MSQFLSGGGVECGPVNVLKSVSTRLDRDYSVQQDRLVSTPNTSGPSSHAFRPTYRPSRSAVHSQQPRDSFDLSALRNHLSPGPSQTQTPARQQSPWADAFALQAEKSVARPQNVWNAEFHRHRQSPLPQFPMADAHPQMMSSEPPRQRQQHALYPMIQPYPKYQQHYLSPPPMVEQPLRYRDQPVQPDYIPTERPAESLTDSQEILATTAQSLVSALDTERTSEVDSKLQKSKFMALMRGLGEKKVVVQDGSAGIGEEVGEGAKLVERSGGSNWAEEMLEARKYPNQASVPVPTSSQQAFQAPLSNGLYGAHPSIYESQQDQQPPVSTAWDQEFEMQEALIQSDRPSRPRSKSVHFNEDQHTSALGSGVPNNLAEASGLLTGMAGAGVEWEEDLDFDEDAFMAYNGDMTIEQAGGQAVGERESWGELQHDWEAFTRDESRRKGKSPMRGFGRGDKVERYAFQRRNPYEAGRDQELSNMGVLELESLVQHNPSSSHAWFSLGLAQQANEREDAAILALSKSVQLDPSFREAYLALGVSYTNEGQTEAAHTVLERWLELSEGNEQLGELDQYIDSGDREQLVQRLIGLARQDPESIDPDVQIALGVLFNSSEDYAKAEDCFLAALDVRPDDWVLYNRLGATLANSGRSNEAIEYYHKALSLNPTFVRALYVSPLVRHGQSKIEVSSFNLGISYINLSQYPAAATSILQALHLQHSDATQASPAGSVGEETKKGITSHALWTSLRNACMHMNRLDLVDLAEKKDLSGETLKLSHQHGLMYLSQASPPT
ncbi:peroxin-5, partial [Tremellales sp. Uapishka_1]